MYLDTWSGYEAAKTAPWPNRGLHQFGKFLEPSDELAGQGCCCFLMWWHSWAFLAHQEWAPKICWIQIWIFQFQHFRCLSDILATSCTNEAQIQLLHFLEGIVLGFCLFDTEQRTVFHVFGMLSFFILSPIVQSIFGKMLCYLPNIYV